MTEKKSKKRYKINSEDRESVNNKICGVFSNDNDGVIADPNGSYTGVAYPIGEKTVQDADDL